MPWEEGPVDLITYWTVRDSADNTGMELGPLASREQAESDARRYRFPFLVFHRDYRDDGHSLVRAEHVIYRLPDIPLPALRWRVYCTQCGAECPEAAPSACENWRDFHEFENMGHQTVELRWSGEGWLTVRRSTSLP